MPSTAASDSTPVNACIARVWPMPSRIRAASLLACVALPRMIPPLSQYRNRTRRKCAAWACWTTSCIFIDTRFLPTLSSTGTALLLRHLRNDLLVAHVFLRATLADKVDDNTRRYRDQRNRHNKDNPLLRVDVASRGPGTGENHDHTDCAGQAAQHRTQIEDPVRGQLNAREGLTILATNNDDIYKEYHHREAPDDCHRRLQHIIDVGRKVLRGKACLDGIGDNHKDQNREEACENGLDQHGHPGHLVGVHLAHHRRQTTIQAGDKE